MYSSAMLIHLHPALNQRSLHALIGAVGPLANGLRAVEPGQGQVALAVLACLGVRLLKHGQASFAPNRGNGLHKVVHHLTLVVGRGGKAEALSAAGNSWVVNGLDVDAVAGHQLVGDCTALGGIANL